MDRRYTGDGLHLNAAGYDRWVARLKQVGAL
jgi:lysophospholipase L1-like esterase